MSTWIIKTTEIESVCNRMRNMFGLSPRRHSSNFIFKNKNVEHAHVMKRAMIEIYNELHEKHEAPLNTK